MKALLLAAGLGTRLRPFTFFRAKATLPLLNVPFICYPLQFLHNNNIEDVVLNLHAHPDSVRQAAGDSFGPMAIRFSHEPQILGTAGAIRKAFPLMNSEEPFVVMNGDMITDVPLQDVLAQHRQTSALVTLVVMPARPNYKGLFFETAEHLVLQGFQPNGGREFHFTGLQIVSPEVVGRIPEGRCEIFTDVYPSLIKEGKIFGFLYEDIWREIGTLKEYLQTNLHYLNEPLPDHLRPPDFEASAVSRNAAVKSERVQNSVVMDNAVVDDNASIENCIIGWGTTVIGEHRNVALMRGILPWHII